MPSPPVAGQPTAPDVDKPYPRTVAQAQQFKDEGHTWTNCEIRIYYNKLVSEIAAQDEASKQAGKSLEERAHAAFDIRHNARITARAMMANEAEVEQLRERDREKYGNPDGPTFDILVEKNRAKGLSGDDIYTSIIASSQRTDTKVNEECGIRSTFTPALTPIRATAFATLATGPRGDRLHRRAPWRWFSTPTYATHTPRSYATASSALSM